MNLMTFHILGCHHPNWRTHIFQRGGSTTNQICIHLYLFYDISDSSDTQKLGDFHIYLYKRIETLNLTPWVMLIIPITDRKKNTKAWTLKLGHPWVAGLLWSSIGYETMNMDFIYLRKAFLSWDDHRPLIQCFDPHMERWGNTKASKSYMAHQYQSISIQFDWYLTIIKFVKPLLSQWCTNCCVWQFLVRLKHDIYKN
jgi:hypothetical protein